MYSTVSKKYPIVRKWMKCKNDTNSGHPLLEVDVYEDWMEIECPVCKTKHELTDSHLEHFDNKSSLVVGTYYLVLFLASYKAWEILIHIIDLWKT